jgi:hypothetical protein
VSYTGFIAAIAANLAYGDYECPSTANAEQSQWVIVSTWGVEEAFLSLSLTNIEVSGSASAPPGLQPIKTHLGVLISRTISGSEEESEYLLVRHRPADISLGGIFMPTDGYVRLSHRDASLRLTAHGRYAHCYGVYQEMTVIEDISRPAPGCSTASAWHLKGTSRPWAGEFKRQGANNEIPGILLRP